MLKAGTVNITKNFVTSGVKESGGYIYVLMIALTGETIIKRILADNSEIKFVKKSDEQSVADFWLDPTIHTYQYVHSI